jgi:hypothetical protein
MTVPHQFIIEMQDDAFAWLEKWLARAKECSVMATARLDEEIRRARNWTDER